MPSVKWSILFLFQFVSYCFYAQSSSKIILGHAVTYHFEILSGERFDGTNTIATLSEKKSSKSLVQTLNPAPIAPSKRNIDEDNPLGLNWSIGLGVGYSAHASSYSEDNGLRVKEFSGFRAIVLDAKIGWSFFERIGIFGTWKYAPGNSIISPYRSNYLGGGLACYFGDLQQFSIHGGLGKYQTKVGRSEGFGNGLLVNYGTVIKLTDNFGFELNVLSGKVKLDDASSTIPDSMEFNFTAGVAVLF